MAKLFPLALPTALVLPSVVCLASIASAQTNWARTYGGASDDKGYSVEQTTDGGFIIAGEKRQSYDSAYVIKTNASGDTLWTRTYGGALRWWGYSAQQTNDGGYIVAGSECFLVKMNASGDTLWTRDYGLPHHCNAYITQQTADDGYVIVGGADSLVGSGGVWLVKTDSSGDTLWTRTYGAASADKGNSVQQTTDGGYVVAGTAFSDSGVADVYLVKTNAQGETLWTRTYGGPYGDWGNSVQQTSDGGYIIAGVTYSFGPATPTYGNVYLIKTDAEGDTLWAKTYGGAGDEGGSSVRQTVDGGYIITGHTNDDGTTAGVLDVYLLKTDALGNALWTRTYSGVGYAEGYSVQQTSDSDYVVAGWTQPIDEGDYDVYLIKTNGLLDIGPVAILSPPATAESGSVYVPRVVVRNFGLTSGSTVQVTADIGSGYSQTVQETLVSVPLDTVVFPPWTAGPIGTLPVTCFTSLVGDEDPTNDTIGDSIQVVPPPRHDVGAIAIISPFGMVRAGDTAIPRAQIRNFGNTAERFFGVRFRIGTRYSRTANVANALLPDSTVELTFAPWVADSGTWAVICSTMLVSDMDRTNDKVSSSVRVFAQSLQIEPDRSERLEAGKGQTYQFYALIQGDTGAVVEVARPSAPMGWSLRLGNATGANDLTDTDGDGIPDLGYVAPGESGWFSLDVTAPSGLAGDTASLARPTFLIAGHLGDDSLVADTAVLSLTLMPAFSIHNFPNPFSDHTAFVIGLPEDGKASLTVYTRDGARVCRVLENSDLPAGVHVVPWEGVNDNGRRIAPGTYEYLLDYVHAGKTERIRKKLVLTRQ